MRTLRGRGRASGLENDAEKLRKKTLCVALNVSKRTVASCGTYLSMQLWSLDMQYISLYNWAFLVDGFAMGFCILFFTH